jgi:hypothetical protein
MRKKIAKPGIQKIRSETYLDKLKVEIYFALVSKK